MLEAESKNNDNNSTVSTIDKRATNSWVMMEATNSLGDIIANTHLSLSASSAGSIYFDPGKL
jgi:hypothetical protein